MERVLARAVLAGRRAHTLTTVLNLHLPAECLPEVPDRVDGSSLKRDDIAKREAARVMMRKQLVACAEQWCHYLVVAEPALSERLHMSRADDARMPTWKETAAFALWMLRKRAFDLRPSEVWKTKSAVELCLKHVKDHIFLALYPAIARLTRGERRLYWTRVEQSFAMLFTNKGRERWKDAAETNARARALRSSKGRGGQAAVQVIATVLHQDPTVRTLSPAREVSPARSSPTSDLEEYMGQRRLGLVDYLTVEQKMKRDQQRLEQRRAEKEKAAAAERMIRHANKSKHSEELTGLAAKLAAAREADADDEDVLSIDVEEGDEPMRAKEHLEAEERGGFVKVIATPVPVKLMAPEDRQEVVDHFVVRSRRESHEPPSPMPTAVATPSAATGSAARSRRESHEPPSPLPSAGTSSAAAQSRRESRDSSVRVPSSPLPSAGSNSAAARSRRESREPPSSRSVGTGSVAGRSPFSSARSQGFGSSRWSRTHDEDEEDEDEGPAPWWAARWKKRPPPIQEDSDSDEEAGLVNVEVVDSRTAGKSGWTCAELSKAVCNIMMVEKLIKAKPAELKTKRRELEEKLTRIFQEAGLNGPLITTITESQLEALLKAHTRGQVWVANVQKVLEGMLENHDPPPPPSVKDPDSARSSTSSSFFRVAPLAPAEASHSGTPAPSARPSEAHSGTPAPSEAHSGTPAPSARPSEAPVEDLEPKPPIELAPSADVAPSDPPPSQKVVPAKARVVVAAPMIRANPGAMRSSLLSAPRPHQPNRPNALAIGAVKHDHAGGSEPSERGAARRRAGLGKSKGRPVGRAR